VEVEAMCGRYYIAPDAEYPEIGWILEAVAAMGDIRTGEVFPSHTAAVLSAEGWQAMRWGMRFAFSKRAIINSRAETVEEKPSFRESFRSRRCVVPMLSFFEWDGQKKRHAFSLEPPELLHVAGLYATIDGSACFTVITTAANPSMKGIHDRMPLVIRPSQEAGWLGDLAFAREVLRTEPVALSERLA
jgi:putative SOS response-associated peptidase YedK